MGYKMYYFYFLTPYYSYIRYFLFDLKILLDINCCDQNRKEIYFLLELQITKDIQLK